MVSKNKRGVTTVTLILMCIFALALLGVLGVGSWAFGLVDDAFEDIDFTLGNTSFNDTYAQTIQPGIQAMETSVPTTIATGTLLGLVIALMIVGFNVKRVGRLWILFDIGIIIIAEVVAEAVRAGFVSFMNSSPELLQVYSTTLATPSRYVLNLPLLVPVIGALIMLVTYISIGKKEEPDFEATF